MKKEAYFPKAEPKRVLWFNTFAFKLKNSYATLFGISNADADKYLAWAAFYAHLIGWLTGLHDFSKDVTDYKDKFGFGPPNSVNPALPVFNGPTPPPTPDEAGVFDIIFTVIQNIKSHPKYTENIGKDLGIVGAEQVFDPDTYKPKGIGVPTPGHAKISFDKLGVEAMAVYSHPANDPTQWIKLGVVNHSPFVDGQALANGPAKRQYKLRGVIDDEEIGEWSEIIEVTVSE